MTMKKGGSVASPQKAGAHKPADTGASGVSINPEGVVNIDFKQASEQVDENGVTLGQDGGEEGEDDLERATPQ